MEGGSLGSLLEKTAQDIGLDFKNDLKNYFLVAWRGMPTLKIEDVLAKICYQIHSSNGGFHQF